MQLARCNDYSESHIFRGRVYSLGRTIRLDTHIRCAVGSYAHFWYKFYIDTGLSKSLDR